MSEKLTNEQYEAKIAELTKENEKLKKENNNANDETFQDIKNKYEEIIENKNQEINTLQKEVENEKKKVNETVDTLKDEVQAKLDANEEYQKVLATVQELKVEQAETTVDTYIRKGVILPAQRETAVKLCLNDNDTFTELYKDAKPIVNVEENKSKRINSLAKGLAYFDE